MRGLALALIGVALGAELPLPLDEEALTGLSRDARAGRVPDVGERLRAARDRARGAGDATSEAWAEVGLAAVDEHLRRFTMARRGLEGAAARVRERDASFPGRALLWMALEAERDGRAPRARHWAELALKELEQPGDLRRRAVAWRLVYLPARGRERLELSELAFQATRAIGHEREGALIEADYGEALRRASDLAGAIRHTAAAAQTLEKLGLPAEAAHAVAMLARSHLAHGQSREALFHIARAERLLGAEAESPRVRVEIASLLAALNENQRALQHLARAAGSLETPLGPSLVATYLRLGQYERVTELARRYRMAHRAPPPAMVQWMESEALFHLGRHEDAVAAASGALRAADQPDAFTDLSALRWRARALDQLGRHDEAARDVLALTERLEIVFARSAPDDEWKRALIDGRKDVADDMIGVLWRAGRQTEALAVAEQFRARALLELVAVAAPEPAARPSILAEYAAAHRCAVISYWVHPQGVYAWLFTAQGEMRAAATAVEQRRLASLVERARRMDYQPDRAVWRELHRLLIGPVERWLPARPGSLVVLGHGPILHLPFAALLNGAGRYLVEDFQLRTVPAAGFLTREDGPVAEGVVLMGSPAGVSPPLPGARRELARVRLALAGQAAVVVEGSALSPQRVGEEVGRAGVLHFATHAVVDERAPFASFLALSAGEKLTVESVYRMKLKASLVTLSACRGGSGRVSTDGLLGFPRAFLYAGAASVLAPLWDVPDETTTLLMEDFYRGRAAQASNSAALRQAQLKLIANLRAGRLTVATGAGPMTLPEHPALWAGFVLTGVD